MEKSINFIIDVTADKYIIGVVVSMLISSVVVKRMGENKTKMCTDIYITTLYKILAMTWENSYFIYTRTTNCRWNLNTVLI